MTQIEILAKALGVTPDQLNAVVAKGKEQAQAEKKASRKFNAVKHTAQSGNVGVKVTFSRGYPVYLFKTQIVELLANVELLRKLAADPDLTSAS
jgi:hypothetical protein